jgi:hypothetical protein
MSNSHGLSDEQVSNELKRMVAFIKQEAIEKSREIHIKVNSPIQKPPLTPKLGRRGICNRKSKVGTSGNVTNRYTVRGKI